MDNDKEQPNSAIVIEEDWSSFIGANNSNQSGAVGSHQLTGFARHNIVTIPLSPPPPHPADNDNGAHDNEEHDNNDIVTSLTIHCVEALTPLDMINLSNGNHDSTGHRIWMGALLFLESFVCTLPPLETMQNDHNQNKSNESDAVHANATSSPSRRKCEMIQLLSKWRIKLFHQKKAIELGTGTGVSGISLLVNNISNTVRDSKSGGEMNGTMKVQPSSMILTDSDEEVLDLCRKNVSQNGIVTESNKNSIDCDVCKLEWGNDDLLFKSDTTLLSSNELQATQCIIMKQSQDTVIATDVIYDISAIQPLFQTAASLLKPFGYFCLSHVPRASIEDCCRYNEEKNESTRDIIERLILKEAKRWGFRIVALKNSYEGNNDYCCIRPKDLSLLQRKMITSKVCDFEEMESIGVGIFIFEYMGD